MALTVGQLKELLAKFDDADLVVLQADASGNGFAPLAGGYDMIYVAESPGSGDVYPRELSAEDRADGYTEADLYRGPNGQPALVLYPVDPRCEVLT